MTTLLSKKYQIFKSLRSFRPLIMLNRSGSWIIKDMKAKILFIKRLKLISWHWSRTYLVKNVRTRTGGSSSLTQQPKHQVRYMHQYIAGTQQGIRQLCTIYNHPVTNHNKQFWILLIIRLRPETPFYMSLSRLIINRWSFNVYFI